MFASARLKGCLSDPVFQSHPQPSWCAPLNLKNCQHVHSADMEGIILSLISVLLMLPPILDLMALGWNPPNVHSFFLGLKGITVC